MSRALTTTTAAAPVATTVASLTASLERRGIPVLAVVDHAAGAASVGLPLADEVVVIFGNPAVGTPVMQADPRAGIALPLRILVWDDDGVTRIGYEDPHELASSFALPAGMPQLDAMTGLLAQLAADAATTAHSSSADPTSARVHRRRWPPRCGALTRVRRRRQGDPRRCARHPPSGTA